VRSCRNASWPAARSAARRNVLGPWQIRAVRHSTCSATQGVPTSGPHLAAPNTSLTTTTIDALRAAGEEGNADAVAELLAPDVVLHSPMSATKVFSGRDAVTALHRDIFAILDDVGQVRARSAA
jgi:hypothetical protein